MDLTPSIKFAANSLLRLEIVSPRRFARGIVQSRESSMSIRQTIAQKAENLSKMVAVTANEASVSFHRTFHGRTTRENQVSKSAYEREEPQMALITFANSNTSTQDFELPWMHRKIKINIHIKLTIFDPFSLHMLYQ